LFPVLGEDEHPLLELVSLLEVRRLVTPRLLLVLVELWHVLVLLDLEEGERPLLL
jgi:hypothetical protein